jgi:hypothetical protein
VPNIAINPASENAIMARREYLSIRLHVAIYF